MGTKSNLWSSAGMIALLAFFGIGYYGITWWKEDDAIYTIHIRARAMTLSQFEEMLRDRGAVITNHWDNYRIVEITGANYQERVLLREDAFEAWKRKYGGK